MAERTSPEPQRMNASAMRQHWSEVVNKVFREKSRVIVEKSGLVVGALVSEVDLARLEALDREQQERQSLMERMRAAFADVPEDELLEESVRIVRQIRAEEYNRRQHPDSQ